MTEHDDKQPLTRRERRLRELGETGALDLSEAVTRPAAEQQKDQETVSGSATEVAPASDDSEEIVIDPLNPDGTPRSRREIRALREQAMAERAHAQSEAAGVDAAVASGAEAVQEEASAELAEADSAPHSLEDAAKVEEEVLEDGVNEQPGADLPVEPEAAPAESEAAPAVEELAEPETVAVPKVDASAAAPKAETEVAEAPEAPAKPEIKDAADPEPDFDSLIAPPTEAYNVDELREAEQVSSDPESADASGAADEVEQAAASEDAAAEPAEEAEPAAEAKPKRRFWQRGRAAEESEAPAAEADEAPAAAADEAPEAAEAPEVASEPAVEASADDEDAAPATEEPETAPEPAEAEQPAAEPIPAPRPAAPAPAPQPPAAQAPAPAPAQKPEAQKESYSFPDIAPPEEWRSVFDDHSTRAMPTTPKGDGDFDDLISRAVAQEGSTASSTSALILPNMPEDTGGLTGPLGATGELYVTGSLKLPKSLGETGGHSALHDSVEIDPITGNTAAEETALPADGPSPVAARHAVSARVSTGANVVAKPAKEKSKLPLILSLTGGGLLIVVVGIGIWGATNGMFG